MTSDGRDVAVRAGGPQQPTRFGYQDASVALAAVSAQPTATSGDCACFERTTGRLTWAVFDAMGNDRRSAELVTAVWESYEEARRGRLSLAATASRLDALVASRRGGKAFCTGLLAELDVATGELRTLSAGHPPPLLLDPIVGAHDHLPTTGNLAFGLHLHDDVAGQGATLTTYLQPGQSVVAFTAGVTEARDPRGGFFGSTRVASSLTQQMTDGRSPADAAEAVMADVHQFQAGAVRDDATLLLVRWRR